MENSVQLYGTVEAEGVNITTHPRCGDIDRQRAMDRVSEAYAHGYLDSTELEARQNAINRCTLLMQLSGLLEDIPAIRKGKTVEVKRPKSKINFKEYINNYQPVLGIGAMLLGIIIAIVPGVVGLALGFKGALETAMVAPSVSVGIFSFIVGGVSLLVYWEA